MVIVTRWTWFAFAGNVAVALESVLCWGRGPGRLAGRNGVAVPGRRVGGLLEWALVGRQEGAIGRFVSSGTARCREAGSGRIGPERTSARGN